MRRTHLKMKGRNKWGMACRPGVSALGRLREEDGWEVQAHLGYTAVCSDGRRWREKKKKWEEVVGVCIGVRMLA